MRPALTLVCDIDWVDMLGIRGRVQRKNVCELKWRKEEQNVTVGKQFKDCCHRTTLHHGTQPQGTPLGAVPVAVPASPDT